MYKSFVFFILLCASNCFINLKCHGSIPISSVPPPPTGCSYGSVMYTHYLRTVYLYTATDPTNQTIDEYRYIFGSDISVNSSCYSNPTLFYGPSPSGSGTVAVGCDINKNTYAETVHNDSYNFTINCPIDDQVWLLFISSSLFVYFIFKKLNRQLV